MSSTTLASLESRLHELIVSCLPQDAPAGGLRPEMSLRSDLGMDSVQLLLLLFKFEQEFGVEFPLHALSSGTSATVGDVVGAARQLLVPAAG